MSRKIGQKLGVGCLSELKYSGMLFNDQLDLNHLS